MVRTMTETDEARGTLSSFEQDSTHVSLFLLEEQ